MLLLRREAEAGNRRIAALRETLNKTREQEALDRKRAFVENVAKLAATGREKALRRAALSEELRQLTVEISAICGVVREANEVGRGIGLARIGDPTAGILLGFSSSKTPKRSTQSPFEPRRYAKRPRRERSNPWGSPITT